MKVKLSKEFQSRLVSLKKSGKKNQYQQAMMVLSEMQMEVKISKAFRKETRIPNSYKYELPDGYRIVFQKIDGFKDLFLALTVGSHDQVDRYSDHHKGWIFDPETHGLKEMRLSTASEEQVDIVRSPDLKQQKVSEQSKISKVFRDLTPDLILKAGVPKDRIDYAFTLDDPYSLEVMQFLESLNPRACDLLLTYITGGIDARNEIVYVLEGKREYHPYVSKSTIDGLQESSDQFVDLRDLPEEHTAFDALPFEDWMLFLHPDQKSLVTRDFNGPVRLRGVSGSGKTVVAIHKARHIATKIIQEGSNEFVLFLTFNKSLADLVDNLVGQLCLTTEAKRIEVHTVDKWCRDYVMFRSGNIPRWDELRRQKIWSDSVFIHLDILNKKSLCTSVILNSDDLKRDGDIQFLQDEIDFIFGKFIHQESEDYLICNRAGRGRRLSKNQRKTILELYKTYHINLVKQKQFVSKELNRIALDLLTKGSIDKIEPTQVEYSAIIVDEVQDLSEIELRIIKELAGIYDDKLFLVGDGAQRIYTRGYSMQNIGINVVGRSFVLKQNYRNTMEIMKAAALLMESEEIGKYDEEPEIAQTIANFSSHTSDKPLLMIAENPKQEWDTIAREIRYLIGTLKILPHEICCLARVQWERNGIKESLQKLGIPSVDYRAEGIAPDDRIKISSLHNSKGHEFRVVFIAGLFEGAIPIHNTVDPENLEKEAALLIVICSYNSCQGTVVSIISYIRSTWKEIETVSIRG